MRGAKYVVAKVKKNIISGCNP